MVLLIWDIKFCGACLEGCLYYFIDSIEKSYSIYYNQYKNRKK